MVSSPIPSPPVVCAPNGRASGRVASCGYPDVPAALVVAARRQGKHARRVEQRYFTIKAGAGAGHFDGGAGVVGNVNVSAGQAVKKYRFTDVGVADEQDGVGRRAKCGQGSVHGQWISGVAKWPAGAEPAINVRLSKAACDDLRQCFAIAG